MKQLPAGTTSWMPELSSLHATIFHPGLAPGTAGSPRLVAPSAQALDRELHTARRFASSVPANLTLVVRVRLGLGLTRTLTLNLTRCPPT